MPRKMEDLTGRRFGRLTVVGLAESTYAGRYWLCKCECGNEINVQGSNLRSGNVTSCKCYRKEMQSITQIKHNMCHTKLYKVYSGILNRCKNKKWKYYHGKGITICNEWKNDFMAFYNWATLNGYKEGLSIDRIDNDGNYDPNNCKWSTVKEQQRNRSVNHVLEFQGENKCISEWAEILNIDKRTILSRIRAGWSIEEALTRAIQKGRK